jgi:DNA-binding MarR family transcriptional regulator
VNDRLDGLAARIDCLMPTLLRRICTLDGPRIELPMAQLRLCAILHNGPLSMSALSRELGTSVSATTQLADRLEAIGLVERLTEPADRRTRTLRLTAHGSELMETSRHQRLARWKEVLARVSEERRALLVELLEELVAASRATCPEEAGGVDVMAGRAAEILLQTERNV